MLHLTIHPPHLRTLIVQVKGILAPIQIGAILAAPGGPKVQTGSMEDDTGLSLGLPQSSSRTALCHATVVWRKSS